MLWRVFRAQNLFMLDQILEIGVLGLIWEVNWRVEWRFLIFIFLLSSELLFL